MTTSPHSVRNAGFAFLCLLLSACAGPAPEDEAQPDADTGTTPGVEWGRGCGNGQCAGWETCSSCPRDCGTCAATCGDATCDAGEDCTSCAQDCGTCPATCGDGMCGADETCTSCTSDCGECPATCGDSTCATTESCSSCAQDCGTCPATCGDGTCSTDETCSSCASDCGACPQPGTTYYVRMDGGDASQCTGLTDAAYPGSGTGRPCAWKSPTIALPPSGSARIAGGDTLIIGPGSYVIGEGGPMQAIPSGPTSTQRTRILGKAGTPPKLLGTKGVVRVINLDGRSNVELGNLEVTDTSDCVYNHSQAIAACPAAGSGTWAKFGVYARASRNVWIHDFNVHGMGHTGFHAGGLTDWTLERVKSNKNGRAGWDTNIGSTGSENAGHITMREIELGWNGCGERWQTGEPWACWGQQSGGYGDGFSSTATNGHGGTWLIEDAYFHHNTQDGLDLLYMNGASSTSVTIRRLRAVANTGQQLKLKGSSLIESSIIVGYCTYFLNKYYMLETDLCRGYGAPVILVLTGDDTATVRHNTITGQGPNLITYQDGTSTDRIYIQNNVGIGFPYYRGSGQTAFTGGPAPGAKSHSGNLAWTTSNCPSGTTCGVDPKLTNTTLAGFDAMPVAGSPVIDAAPSIGVVGDFFGNPRPVGPAPDIGAIEVQAP